MEEPDITLRGKISDPEASVSAELNGRSLGKLKVATSSGQFTRALTLSEGNNKITVESISAFGSPLVATVSGIFTPKEPLLNTNQIIGLGVLIILLIVLAGVWWYYKKHT